jgi:transcriptional regulator with XRE-family HTH domain
MLKELIKVKGVKQKWLAQRLGVSEVTVSNWMQDKAAPSRKHMEKISEVLNIPFKELIS